MDQPEPAAPVRPSGASVGLEHVSFSYDRKDVLHDISLQVNAGASLIRSLALVRARNFWTLICASLRPVPPEKGRKKTASKR